MSDLTLPFEGLAPAWQLLFGICLVVIVAMFAWTALLFFRGRRAATAPPPAPAGIEDAFAWVFVVPALNEEATIADSVGRLLDLPLARARVIVVDDGSDDATAEILAGLADPRLEVLRRDPPEARRGKAAALDHAYRSLDVAERESTIVAIVDADGRLAPDAPRFAAAHLLDPRVGGVQSLVRIYNRRNLLTWLQDVEFSVYGHLFQAGRDGWGTAGMGGNGQFNRLAALDEIADADGPWRDRLTEDQDLGVRLIAAGWLGRQELRGTIEQQGLSRLRPLFRQRTRWAQGNLQAIALAGRVRRAPQPPRARLELLLHLLMPVWQVLIGIGLIAAIGLAVAGVAPFWGGGPKWQLAFFYLLGFGGTMLGCVAARVGRGPLGWLRGILIAQIYAPYTWFLWPVMLRAIARLAFTRDEWAKTEREPLEAGAGPRATSSLDRRSLKG